MVKVNIPTFPLNNGGELPALGYGTYLGMDKNFRLLSENYPKMEEALSYAIDIGYRHIDTAHFYRVEPEIGRVINRKIKEGVVKREDLFVTTKVWHHYHREADVEVSVRGSLKRLGLDYVDLVLIHWPMSISEDGVDEKIDYLETWRGFESCVAKGLTKGIGISNFNVEQMNRLLKNCKIPPASLQIEVNLNLGQEELVALCKAHKIVVVAYSPFGTMVPSHALPNSPEPKLDNPTMLAIAKKYGKTVSQIALKHLEDGVDEKIDYLETWRGFESCVAKGLTKGIGISNFNVEQMNRLLKNCKIPPASLQIEVNLNLGQEELVALCKAHKIVVVAYSPFGTMVPSHALPNSPEPKLDNPTMLAIAKKYGKTVSQIALKHLVQRGIAAIPKTNTPSRVLENASIFDFTLSPEDVAALKAFDCGYRFGSNLFWQNYTNFPFEKTGAGDIAIPLPMRKWTDGINN